MSLILSGSEGLSDVDGTAATPAIRGTDTNTGIFFPAADTIAFATAGTEDMRITSTGDVGIGTSSPNGILDARGNVFLGSTSGQFSTFIRSTTNWNFSNLNIVRNAANTSTPRLLSMMLDGDAQDSTTIGAYNAIWGAYDSSPTTGSTSSALNGAMVYGAFAGHRWVTNGTERMRIDSSGNVGIGTSSPAGYRVRIVGASGVPQLRVGTDTGSYLEMNGYDSNPFYCVVGGSSVTAGVFGTQATVPLIFLIANNERGRFDTGGRFLVGTTGSLDDNSRGQFVSTTHALQAQCNATDGGWYAFKCVRIGSTGKFVGFVYGNQSTEVGSISTGGTTTAYNTSSDYRLKHDIAPMTGALARVAALKPVTYKWNVDGSDGEGFIAHELAEVCPDAVTGEKDAVDEDGNPKYQGIDTSFLVATLTAAIQELKAELDTVKTELAALKGTA